MDSSGSRLAIASRPRRIVLAAAALMAVAAGSARADFGTFDYVTGIAVQTGSVAPAAPLAPTGAVSINIGGGNTLTFTPDAATAIDATLPGGADILPITITFTPSGTNDGTFVYTVSYNFTLAVKDEMGGDTHNFNFTGTISGDVNGLAPVAINSTLSNITVTPTSQKYLLGTYNALNKGGTGPGSAGGVVTDGKLEANIAAAVPEPASLALVGLGGLALLALRRRRVGA